jgi:prepilin-type N-terminal cleavage/methylation domain-containing protein
MTNKKLPQKGFTIIELLIATAVFSLVLVIFLTALVRISQLFYKGVSLTNTQEATRNVIQTISDDIQFSNESPAYYGDYFCIGGHRYTLSKGVQVGSGDPADYGIVRESMNTCKSPFTAPPTGEPVNTASAEKLLDPGMQLNNLTIDPDTVTGSVRLKILVVYYGSDKGVFSSPTASHNDPNDVDYDAYKAIDAQCTGHANSSQFCATADYETTILQNF